MLNAVLSPLNPCKLCSLLLSWVHNGGMHAVKAVFSIYVSKSWAYTYSTIWETEYGETVNKYSCFLLKSFKRSHCRNVLHDCVHPVTFRLLRQRKHNPQFSGVLAHWEYFNGKYQKISVIMSFECSFLSCWGNIKRQRWDASQYT